MKFYSSWGDGPIIGTTKIIERFLWLPKYGAGEIRWLENAKYEIRAVQGYLSWEWKFIRWID